MPRKSRRLVPQSSTRWRTGNACTCFRRIRLRLLSRTMHACAADACRNPKGDQLLDQYPKSGLGFWKSYMKYRINSHLY